MIPDPTPYLLWGFAAGAAFAFVLLQGWRGVPPKATNGSDPTRERPQIDERRERIAHWRGMLARVAGKVREGTGVRAALLEDGDYLSLEPHLHMYARNYVRRAFYGSDDGRTVATPPGGGDYDDFDSMSYDERVLMMLGHEVARIEREWTAADSSPAPAPNRRRRGAWLGSRSRGGTGRGAPP